MSVGGGGGRGKAGRFNARGEINVTPLIDIVLVLLIVFMVMTPVMLKELVAKIPQQQTDNTPQPPGDNPIVVELAADGTLAMAGEPLALEALADAVGERLRHDRRKVVFFRVDDRANYGRAVKVMDICKGAGAATLGIVTTPLGSSNKPDHSSPSN
jgi:biopolymer transport protein ExbD